MYLYFDEIKLNEKKKNIIRLFRRLNIFTYREYISLKNELLIGDLKKKKCIWVSPELLFYVYKTSNTFQLLYMRFNLVIGWTREQFNFRGYSRLLKTIFNHSFLFYTWTLKSKMSISSLLFSFSS